MVSSLGLMLFFNTFFNIFEKKTALLPLLS